jgi:hypothetical protein
MQGTPAVLSGNDSILPGIIVKSFIPRCFTKTLSAALLGADERCAETVFVIIHAHSTRAAGTISGHYN